MRYIEINKHDADIAVPAAVKEEGNEQTGVRQTFRSFGEKRLGVVEIWIASVLGIASPLCMYGTIPIAAFFSKSGIRDDWPASLVKGFEARNGLHTLEHV